MTGFQKIFTALLLLIAYRPIHAQDRTSGKPAESNTSPTLDETLDWIVSKMDGLERKYILVNGTVTSGRAENYAVHRDNCMLFVTQYHSSSKADIVFDLRKIVPNSIDVLNQNSPLVNSDIHFEPDQWGVTFRYRDHAKIVVTTRSYDPQTNKSGEDAQVSNNDSGGFVLGPEKQFAMSVSKALAHAVTLCGETKQEPF
jgi:hypothetical protein